MHYYLMQAVLGRPPKLSLTEDEYAALQKAWAFMSVLMAIEEEWDCLIQNYIDLETELLGSALHWMIRNYNDYQKLNDTRLRLSRRLSNLLQSCRSYLDHTSHDLSRCGVTGAEVAFAQARSTAYDAHFSYRFMEELRNHAQHRGVPLHGMTLGASWKGGEDGLKTRAEYTSAARVDLKRIRADPKFKKRILAEIKDERHQLDIAILTREYIEGLGQVHEEVRKCLSETFVQSKALVSGAINRYAAANDGEVLGLSIWAASGENETRWEDRTNIFADLFTRVEVLTDRNGRLVNLRRGYVTGASRHPA